MAKTSGKGGCLMIEVKIFKSGKSIEAIEISGHANYAPGKEDIVCAAVSTLFQSLVIGLNDVLGVKVYTVIEEGYAYIDYYIQDSGLTDSINTLLNTFRETVNILSVQYNKHVKLIEMEVQKNGNKRKHALATNTRS